VTTVAARTGEARAAGGARDRIVRTAYDLFSHHGIRAVGIDRIVAEADVAKMTLYRHFASKDALVLEVLRVREQVWTYGWLQAEIERRAKTPADRLLVIFDVLDGWFRGPDYEGCTFIRTVMEMHDPASPAHVEAVRRLDNVRKLLRGYARDAGVADADGIAHQVHIVMMGAIVSASRGDRQAARRAGKLVELLLQAA
jgi:AcrR family transcriptional regulator